MELVPYIRGLIWNIFAPWGKLRRSSTDDLFWWNNISKFGSWVQSHLMHFPQDVLLLFFFFFKFPSLYHRRQVDLIQNIRKDRYLSKLINLSFFFFYLSGVGNRSCSYHFSTILGWNQRTWAVHTRFQVQRNSEHDACPFCISIWLIIIIWGDVIPESYSSVLSYFWEIQQLNYTDLHKLKIRY